jgi:hypothetical protein
MGKFPVKIFKPAVKFSKKIKHFESVAKFSKFENLPVAHHMAHALRVIFLKKFDPPHTPPGPPL